MICLQNSAFRSGLDLNLERQTYDHLRDSAKGWYAPRQARFLSALNLSSYEHLSQLSGQTPGRPQGQGLLMPASRQEAKSDICDHIEGFYNRVRRHSHHDQMSPLAFEQLQTGS